MSHSGRPNHARSCSRCSTSDRIVLSDRPAAARARTNPASTRAPRVPYRETIRKSASSRGRHKRQSGGHGQYGDVVLQIEPMPRGKGARDHGWPSR